MLKVFKVLAVFLLFHSAQLVAEQKMNLSKKENYLCIKVKKNLVEYCNNKVFAKTHSFTIRDIARDQVASTKPPMNKNPLNYQQLDSMVHSKKVSHRVASNVNADD